MQAEDGGRVSLCFFLALHQQAFPRAFVAYTTVHLKASRPVLAVRQIFHSANVPGDWRLKMTNVGIRIID